jgi:hypothetical protein
MRYRKFDCLIWLFDMFLPMIVMVACVILMPVVFVELSSAMEGESGASAAPQEDYDLYARVIEDKFLTSQIDVVLLERMTVARLVPNRPGSMTMAFFQQQGFFQGLLPQDLVRDFVGTNQARSPLEGRFRLGVRYRFVSEDLNEDREAGLAVPAVNDHRMALHSPSVLDRLAFSRVGRTLKNDHALVYVENRRRDGTGAGFLVWFHRWEEVWELFDTEVVWTTGGGAGESDGP